MTESSSPAVDLQSEVEAMSNQQRVDYLRSLMTEFNLTVSDVGYFSGYAHGHAAAWFCAEDTKRYRPVPARAVLLLKREVAAGVVHRRRQQA